MAGIDSLESTLYYQWLINNNSTSTMLNSIAGTSAVDGISGLGALGNLGSIGSVGTQGSSFASILQSYMTGVNNMDSLTAASMADKLSGVLEEAAKTEDTSSLTYKTVQELYEYFSDQVSAKAKALLGSTGTSNSASKSSSGSSSSRSAVSDMEAMNEQIRKGQEIDISKIDAAVENAFAESMPIR